MIPSGESAHVLAGLMKIPQRPPREPVWLTECDARFLSTDTIQRIVGDLNIATQKRRAAYGPSTVNFRNTIEALQAEVRAREPQIVGTFVAAGGA
jgi:hypothetical protein